jgi:hypothetical protein
MLKLIIPILLMLAVYAYSRFEVNKKNGKQLNANWLKTIKLIHFLSLFICLVNVFLIVQLNSNFSGFWTMKSSVFLCILTSFLIVFLANNFVKTKLEKLYYLLFILGLIISSPFLLFGIISSNNKINYEDNCIRIETNVGIMSSPQHVIYHKKGLVEKFFLTSIFRANETDSISVNYRVDSTEMTFFHVKQTENSLILHKKHEMDSIKIAFGKLN